MNRAEASAAILAGGQGTRMGRADKALLRYEGRRFVDILQEQLAGFDEILFSAAQASPGVALPFVPDVYPNCGPMGGIYSALRAARQPVVLIVACDMPLFQGALADALIQDYRGEDVLICRTADGRLHPLCGVYHTRCLPLWREALETDKLKIVRLLEECNARVFPVPPAWEPCLANINTPEELRALTRQGNPENLQNVENPEGTENQENPEDG